MSLYKMRYNIRLLLLADPASSHTIKWAKSLSEKGIEVFIFGLSKYEPTVYNGSEVTIHSEHLEKSLFNKNDGAILKSVYLKSLKNLKSFVNKIKPDILHAHYASSYGLLGALTGFHPFVLSVWGSDVYDFPNKTFIHKKVFRYNLKKADVILSTSKIMSEEIKKYTSKEIEITPFGIDINQFKPLKSTNNSDENEIVIGTVKLLELQYGLEYLLKAFKIVKDDLPDIKTKLLIVGSGTQEKNLRKLADELNIQNETVFTGYIRNSDITGYLNQMTIAVIPSLKESFGVSVLEAMACEKPVIVSDAPGLTEIVDVDVDGLIIRKCDIIPLSKAIKRLILDEQLRKKFGKNGRRKVQSLYNWENNLNHVISIYKSLMK